MSDLNTTRYVLVDLSGCLSVQIMNTILSTIKKLTSPHVLIDWSVCVFVQIVNTIFNAIKKLSPEVRNWVCGIWLSCGISVKCL